MGVDSCGKERIPSVSEAADHKFQKYVKWPFKEGTHETKIGEVEP
jgi:hypothetical protein